MSDSFGPAPAEEALPLPPAPEGPGLFDLPDFAPPAPTGGSAAAAPARAGQGAEALPAAPPSPAAAAADAAEARPGPEGGAEAAAAPPQPATAYRVLARKYRPRSFAELIGQEALVRTLRNAFASGRVAHAFMLTGVRGVGKTTTARIIARALNCVGPDGQGGPTADPCGICPNCTAILADRHPDVIELDAASNNGVEDVRELREAVRYRPTLGRYKVYILDEVHMLSNAAFNALLKTLEEPPPAVKFIFATTELRKVPATILSRCQTFHLPRVPQQLLRAHYAEICAKEGIAAEEEALAIIARAADGSVRDGLSLLDQAIALGAGRVSAAQVQQMLGLADRALVFDVLEAALAGDMPALLGALDEAHRRGADPGLLLADLLDLVHTLTRLCLLPSLAEDAALPELERSRGAALAARLSVPVLGRAWQMLLKGVAEVNEAPDRRAALAMVLIRLAHLADLPTPGELLRRLSAEEAAQPRPAAAPGAAPGAPPAPRAVAAAGGSPAAMPAPAAPPQPAAAPLPQSWQEVVALAADADPMLHAALRHEVEPVALAPGRIEIFPRPAAPRDLAGRLSRLLEAATGRPWLVALARSGGAPTLAEQARTAEAARLEEARNHPFVQAILAAFPGAEITAVRDATADRYGLSGPAALAAPDHLPDFAPPEAEPVWDEEAPPPEDG